MKKTLTAMAALLALIAVPWTGSAFETAQGVTATPITSLPFTITKPGNYYLPADLTSSSAGPAITVNADQVVIDLNQRTLGAKGLATSPLVGVGIAVLNHEDCVIQNGDITGFGYIGVLLDATDGKREHNLKNEVRHLNFNNDKIGVLVVSASLDEVEHCNFDGGTFGVFDIASLGGDRFQTDNFQEQVPSESVSTQGIGLVTSPGKGVLVEDCNFATEQMGTVLQSAQDKFRFNSFENISVKTHLGGIQEGFGDL